MAVHSSLNSLNIFKGKLYYFYAGYRSFILARVITFQVFLNFIIAGMSQLIWRQY